MRDPNEIPDIWRGHSKANKGDDRASKQRKNES